MSWIEQVQAEAADKVRAELAKPLPEDEYGDEGTFDPWTLFPSLYGSYSSDFDEMALEVLRALELAANDRWDECQAMQRKETLAHHMFREMLCTAELCEYGTSPRVCFTTHRHFRPLLPDLIAKWEAFSRIQWGEPVATSENA